MREIKYNADYIGTNVEEWSINEYKVTRNRDKWLCTCSLKYKRDSKIKCKHIDIVQKLLRK